MSDEQWLAIGEETFTQWVLTALRRRGYLAAHVNAVGTCTNCGSRAIAKMEPGLPDIIAVSPFGDCGAPLILAELKTEKGELSTRRKMIGRNERRRLLPSQLDWARALRVATRRIQSSPLLVEPMAGLARIGGLWRPHQASDIQALIGDDGSERLPWDRLDEIEIDI
jgi:hypothetical protein